DGQQQHEDERAGDDLTSTDLLGCESGHARTVPEVAPRIGHDVPGTGGTTPGPVQVARIVSASGRRPSARTGPRTRAADAAGRPQRRSVRAPPQRADRAAKARSRRGGWSASWPRSASKTSSISSGEK